MSAKLTPGSYNPQTLARKAAQRDAQPVLRSRGTALAQNRYGQVIDHPMELGMDDLPVSAGRAA